MNSLPFVQDAASQTTSSRYATAAVALKATHALYVERRNAVTMLSPDVFRTTFFLPSDVPTGDYSVRVYLFRGGTLLAGATQTLFVQKGGFSEQIARASNNYPLLYGLTCVALAVFTGWFAGVIFRRP